MVASCDPPALLHFPCLRVYVGIPYFILWCRTLTLLHAGVWLTVMLQLEGEISDQSKGWLDQGTSIPQVRQRLIIAHMAVFIFL